MELYRRNFAVSAYRTVGADGVTPMLHLYLRLGMWDRKTAIRPRQVRRALALAGSLSLVLAFVDPRFGLAWALIVSWFMLAVDW